MIHLVDKTEIRGVTWWVNTYDTPNDNVAEFYHYTDVRVCTDIVRLDLNYCRMKCFVCKITIPKRLFELARAARLGLKAAPLI